MKEHSRSRHSHHGFTILIFAIFTLTLPLTGHPHAGHDPLNARDWQAISVLDDQSLPCCTTDELAAVATALAKGTEEMAKVLHEAGPVKTRDSAHDSRHQQLRGSLTKTLHDIAEQLKSLSQQPGENTGRRWLAVTRDVSTALPLMASLSGNGFDGKWTQIIVRLLPRIFDRVLAQHLL